MWKWLVRVLDALLGQARRPCNMTVIIGSNVYPCRLPEGHEGRCAAAID